MADDARDQGIRAAAFAYLADQVQRHGETLPWNVLTTGFEFEGRPLALMNPRRGIWKPALLDLPLSITTTPEVPGRARPYDDLWDEYADRLLYRYQGTRADNRDNAGLHRLMEQGRPLAYFYGVAKGRYLAIWPVYIVDDDPQELTFTVVAALPRAEGREPLLLRDDLSREYAMRLVKQRIHQAAFRERVLSAYAYRCTVCRLRRVELLDAAHILPDSQAMGRPVVSNGLALCRLHHGAFDTYIMGIRPDRVVEIREDVLNEIDGPTLVHALQGVHGHQIVLPRRPELRPDSEYLEERYRAFRAG